MSNGLSSAATIAYSGYEHSGGSMEASFLQIFVFICAQKRYVLSCSSLNLVWFDNCHEPHIGRLAMKRKAIHNIFVV